MICFERYPWRSNRLDQRHSDWVFCSWLDRKESEAFVVTVPLSSWQSVRAQGCRFGAAILLRQRLLRERGPAKNRAAAQPVELTSKGTIAPGVINYFTAECCCLKVKTYRKKTSDQSRNAGTKRLALSDDMVDAAKHVEVRADARQLRAAWYSDDIRNIKG